MSSEEGVMGQGGKGKAGLVPRLRFPEFREAEGWEVGQLGALCELYQPITLSSTDLSMSGEYFVYGANGVIGTHNEYNHEDSEIAVTCRGATCGEVTITKPMSWITGNAMVVKPRNNKLRKEFLFHYFKNHGLKDVISGSAQPQITRSGFAPLKIFLPNYGEQQRIADCLTSIDTLITTQAQKLDALKAHKKGLMQQLFPREGETVPRLRFPQFLGAGEWSEEKLEDLVHLQDGFAFKSADFVSGEDGATRVIRITDINSRNTNEDKVYIPTAFVEHNNLWKYCVEDGDLLLSLTGAAGFNFFTWNGGLAAINQRTAKVTARKKTCHSLLQILDPLIHAKINARGEGQNNNLSKEFLKTIFVLVPEPDEQQLIADCLATLDSLINAETQKLGVLKTHKKGLMQQLFPSVEEVATT